MKLLFSASMRTTTTVTCFTRRQLAPFFIRLHQWTWSWPGGRHISDTTCKIIQDKEHYCQHFHQTQITAFDICKVRPNVITLSLSIGKMGTSWAYQLHSATNADMPIAYIRQPHYILVKWQQFMSSSDAVYTADTQGSCSGHTLEARRWRDDGTTLRMFGVMQYQISHTASLHSSWPQSASYNWQMRSLMYRL